MKIVCAYLCNFRDRKDYFISLMPSGVPSIAAYLESERHDVTLANLSEYGAKNGAEIILRENPDAVAVSIFSFNRTESFRLIRELKKRDKNLIIIAGGQHPTFLHSRILAAYPEIDFIVKGEGEYAVSEILRNPAGFKRNSVISRDRIPDLDDIPYPSRFSGKMIGVDPHEQFRYIITTRGCPSSCTYCSSPYFWERKVTYRSPENIISELKHIQQKYGIIYFSIRDDNFTLNKKRVLEFCRLLSESGIYMMWNCQARVDTIDFEMLSAMKQCGLEHIQFGVESGSEKILKLYEKSTTTEKIKRASEATRKAGVYLSFYLMAGMEGEEDEDINKTVSLLRSSLPHDTIVSPVAYYPGTGIYNRAISDGRINDNIWNEKDDSGMYVIDKTRSDRFIKKLLKESRAVSAKAAYTEKDFAAQRKASPGDCWMTDIIEGDFHIENGDMKSGVELYRKVIKSHPDNIWGYLKTAEALSETNIAESIRLFKQASKIVPTYHGTWLSLAQLEYESGNIKNSTKSAEKALKLNPFDKETISFVQYLKGISG